MNKGRVVKGKVVFFFGQVEVLVWVWEVRGLRGIGFVFRFQVLGLLY